MKRSSIVIALAAVLATLVATTAAFAGGSRDNVLYRYVGQFKGLEGTSVKVTVQNGNHAALDSLQLKGLEQMFATDGKTVITRWTNGKPESLSLDQLVAGDYVTVNVRADRKADIETITKKPAASIGDRGPDATKPTKPLYLFRGILVSAGGDKVTIRVKGGNRNALRLMVVADKEQQEFTTGPETVFLHWADRVPKISNPAEWKAGDRIIIRIRADRDSTLDQVKLTPAKRVADREPKANEAHQNDQS